MLGPLSVALQNKAALPLRKVIILAFLAGAYIALAGFASLVASFSVDNFGLAKLIAALIFPCGLIMISIAGGELFTSNSLIIAQTFQGKVKVSKLLNNWFFVYIGNFFGSITVSLMLFYSGMFFLDHGALAETLVKVTKTKLELSNTSCFLRGIICNWLVCLAVFMSFKAPNVLDKIYLIFVPIFLFVICGYEHSIANMFYIGAGLMCNTESGAIYDWMNIVRQFTFVTLGNIVGGCLFVAAPYYVIAKTKNQY